MYLFLEDLNVVLGLIERLYRPTYTVMKTEVVVLTVITPLRNLSSCLHSSRGVVFQRRNISAWDTTIVSLSYRAVVTV